MAAGWGVLLIIASVWGAITGLFALVVQRLSRRNVTLALAGAPFLWISTEVARAYLPEISFPWALLGYPAAGNPALVQLTTLTGIYGVSFLVAAFNALLVWSGSARTLGNTKRRWGIVAGVTAALLMVAWIGPRFVPKTEAHHVARVVQPNFPENVEYAGDWYADHKADMADLERLSLRPSSAGQPPDLLIWPEAPAPFSFSDPHFGPFISHLAQQFHHPVLVGIIEWKPGTEIVHGIPLNTLVPYNSAAMLNEWGQRTFSYDKMHLVPFGEYEPFPLIHHVLPASPRKWAASGKGRNARSANSRMAILFQCSSATKQFIPAKCGNLRRAARSC